MRIGAAVCLGLLAAAVFSAGCRARRAPAPAVPPRPVRAFTAPPAIVPAARVLAEPEIAETQSPVSVLPQPPLPPAVSQLPPPPRPARRRPVTPAAKPEPEEGAAPETPAEGAPAVRLGEVLPAETTRRLERQLADNAAAARRVLDRARGRRLSRDQADLAARIRAFLRQAEQMRATDLSSAAELSRRAALLAQELDKNLR